MTTPPADLLIDASGSFAETDRMRAELRSDEQKPGRERENEKSLCESRSPSSSPRDTTNHKLGNHQERERQGESMDLAPSRI